MADPPKIQQLFESLPDINARPDSAARTSRITSATTTRGDSVAKIARDKAKAEFPLTPAQTVERYSRYLTAYEKDEIQDYSQIYFFGQTARKIHGAEGKGPNDGYDDDAGRYKCVKHDHLAYRFEVLKGLGKGSFGDVVKAYDHKTKSHQAVKIIRNERRFHKQAQVEIKVLELLKKHDRRNNHNIIHMNDWFVFRNHLCITFDLMHQDLYSALKKDGFRGFTLFQVKRFAAMLLSSLRLLRRQRIIHSDLKPENILLVSKDTDELKVIDFGSACRDHQKVHSYIQSRFYRAPEVILGAGYSMAIDMWSFGCILAELYSGQPLFPGRDEREQLMYQMELLGKPSLGLLASSTRADEFFDSLGEPIYTQDRKGRTHNPGTKKLALAVGTNDELFLDFLENCFAWNPSDRMTPKTATKHPWLQETPSADVSAASAASAAETSEDLGDVQQKMSVVSIAPATATTHTVTKVPVAPLDPSKSARRTRRSQPTVPSSTASSKRASQLRKSEAAISTTAASSPRGSTASTSSHGSHKAGVTLPVLPSPPSTAPRSPRSTRASLGLPSTLSSQEKQK
eukprot:m.70262 g.70262  ORF g.70262 m.70262 type:complete len:570 (-) comp12254_c0_seq1:213-1922(-)